jgi:hypothetical protein
MSNPVVISFVHNKGIKKSGDGEATNRNEQKIVIMIEGVAMNLKHKYMIIIRRMRPRITITIPY